MGMKKLLAVLFSALLLVGVAGCGGRQQCATGRGNTKGYERQIQAGF